MHTIRYMSFETPFGIWHIGCDEEGLTALSAKTPSCGRAVTSDPLLEQGITEILRFFNGRRSDFSLPLHIDGTPFQKAVWDALRRVPYGETRTYTQIAAQIGRPNARRAVGNACGQNPLLLFIPCHRIVAANGIGGFAADVHVKQAILQLEQRYAADFRPRA